MSKYTYKRDDTPDVSGCGFVLVLVLDFTRVLYEVYFRGRIETRNKYIGHDPIDGWFCWNAHTHLYWGNEQKMGGFSPPAWLSLGEVTLTGTYNVVVRIFVCVTEQYGSLG